MVSEGSQVKFDYYGATFCDMVVEVFVTESGWELVRTFTGKVVPLDSCVPTGKNFWE